MMVIIQPIRQPRDQLQQHVRVVAVLIISGSLIKRVLLATVYQQYSNITHFLSKNHLFRPQVRKFCSYVHLHHNCVDDKVTGTSLEL